MNRIREDKFAQGLAEIDEYLRGKEQNLRVTKIPGDIDVKMIRHRVNLTQEEFSSKFGFPVSTLRNWEQGRRKPEGAARILLKIIATKPDMVHQILNEAPI
ncbi:MAG: helix-turn-helix domain-containing protein [Magnetococcales bacterium]|nr:helix-turn-helix domain-containing protein [Magnetococcales bacterium]